MRGDSNKDFIAIRSIRKTLEYLNYCLFKPLAQSKTYSMILPLSCPGSEIGLGLFSSTLTLWTVLHSSYLLSAHNMSASCCDIDPIFCSMTGKEDERKPNVDSSSTMPILFVKRGIVCNGDEEEYNTMSPVSLL